MARMRLSKSVVDGLKAKPKPYIVYDEKLTGFGVRVMPSGEKSWQVEYRPYPGGRGVNKRRMSLGATDKLTFALAEREAKRILADVVSGEDPAKDKAAKRGEITINGLINLYEQKGCYILRGKRQGEAMKPLTKTYTLARLRHHVTPTIGKKRVGEVTPNDIRDMSNSIGGGKTAKDQKIGPRQRVIVRGGEGAARKVVRDVSALFTFAQLEGIRPDNPCDTAKVRKVDDRRMRHLSLDEVTRLGAALTELEGQGVNRKAIDIARLWALTGCRRNEIAALKWAEVDFEQSCLRLEDSKTGRSIRPLAPPALVLLANIAREGKSPFVFPAGSGNSHFQGTKRIWPKAVALANLPGVTPHVLRHTVGATAVSAGESLLMTGALLGHREARSTEIYGHIQQDPAARAVGRVIAPIAKALAGEASATIVPLKRRSGR